MDDDVEIITVDATNVDEQGFLCYKSKRKSEGYQRKRDWLADRFQEGLRIKLLHLKRFEGPRGSFGFIEYIPGEYAWRPVNAKNYMFIHCLWVIGRHKGKGYGSRLLDICLEDARKLGMAGVAVVTRSDSGWLARKKVFLANGFETVDYAPPSFDLMVRRIRQGAAAVFPTDWDERASRYGAGLTVIRSDQCPYIEAFVKGLMKTADSLGIEFQDVELKSAKDVQANAPSPFGVFSAVYNGRLLGSHPFGGRDLRDLLEKTVG